MGPEIGAEKNIYEYSSALKMVDELSDGWIEEMWNASLQVFILIFIAIFNAT